MEAPAPMFEAMDLSFRVPIPTTIEDARELILPNLPWADKHFNERISHVPYNPPPSHKEWPFGRRNNEAFTSEDKFDHTYPERFWPKFAAVPPTSTLGPLVGIRFEYGDLDDVIDLLGRDPETRQAYLPIFFPEDTGANGGKGRVPCTLGYHFMIRSGYLHVGYIMRSCDAFRHFRDDLYMATLLAQHVAGHFGGVKVGVLKFIAFSYHIFDSEQKLLYDRIDKLRNGKTQ